MTKKLDVEVKAIKGASLLTYKGRCDDKNKHKAS